MLAGAVKATLAVVSPGVATTSVGGLGNGSGMTALDWADSALSPTLLVAWTVNVYAAPSVRPVTSMGLLLGPGVVEITTGGSVVE